jgi:hypothetical protein
VCQGAASPGDGDAPVACNEQTSAEAGDVARCCVPFLQSKTTCEESQSAGCASGEFGFSCAGGSRPEDLNASLSCSASASGDYCCTTK